MVNVYLMGKKYEVPEGLTIMGAMEYAGYKLVRGCGCRNGFCGACATIYRIKGERELHAALACQTTVQEDMYVATLPFFPLEKQVYDIEKVKPDAQIMMQLYPEIYSCIGLQRLHQELLAEPGRNAVHRRRPARRFRRVRGDVV